MRLFSLLRPLPWITQATKPGHEPHFKYDPFEAPNIVGMAAAP